MAPSGAGPGRSAGRACGGGRQRRFAPVPSMKRLGLLIFGLMLFAGRAEAQGLSPWVKYGKWLLVAGSAGMNYFALRAHNRAEDAFNAVESRCIGTQARCILGPEGNYLDPEIESFYQSS